MTGALNLFKASNYTTPYIDLWGQCTFCSGNNLVPYRTDWILDHILIRGLTATQAKVISICNPVNRYIGI